MKYACIIVDITHEKLDKVFTYRIPEHLQQVLRIGMEVMVPFGNGNRVITGYIVDFTDHASVEPFRIKEIIGPSEGKNVIEGRLVALAAWMSERYGSTMIQALKTVLPARNKVRDAVKKTIVLKAAPDECKKWEDLFEQKHQKARLRLLRELEDKVMIPGDVLTTKLHVTAETLKFLTEHGIAEIQEERLYRDLEMLKEHAASDRKVILNEAQKQAVQTVINDMHRDTYGTYLIHGVTGSGKTEVYMHMIEDVVQRGGQAIVLIPEIALTYQTVMRFYGRFGDRVSVMNSRLSMGERYDQYQRALEGGLDVVIGPRSALFTPFQNLKLIVIDEEHEHTYKSEHMPCYDAREVAIYRAQTEGASVVLGSATPSLESYYRALKGEYRLLELPGRAGAGRLPKTEIVDLRAELKDGNRSVISRKLDRAIRERLHKKEQIMLFLNRRGYAGHVACRECGYVVKCTHCDVSMSQHRTGGNIRLFCHYCGSEQEMPVICPKCGSRHIGGFRAGTQAVEKLLGNLYPEARILRMDMDSTRDKEGHARILSAFGSGEADILIGTQMIVKGHDFPGVTLVGILAADMSLNTGSYQAAERTFQLLTQAAGRAGRGDRPGEVIIQTYEPDHYALQLSAAQDYRAFYDEEIGFRELLDYPPVGHMMLVSLSGTDQDLTELAADYLKKYGMKVCQEARISCIGPADPGIRKVNDRYRKVMYYKHENYDILIKLRKYLEAYIRVNSGFRDLFIQFDYD